MWNQATVAEVVSGNTVRVQHGTVSIYLRISGLRVPKDPPLVNQGRLELERLVIRKTISFKVHGEESENSASAAFVKVTPGDIDIAHELLRTGWAAIDPCFPSLLRTEEEQREKYQKEAEGKMLGMWQRASGSKVLSPPGPPPPDFQGRREAIVLDILDSTTLRVRFTENPKKHHVAEIRLVGITAPVAAFAPSTPSASYYADEAKASLSRTLIKRTVGVTILQYSENICDGHVEYEDQLKDTGVPVGDGMLHTLVLDLSRFLVRDGLASTARSCTFADSDFLQELLTLEDQARASRRGIHSASPAPAYLVSLLTPFRAPPEHEYARYNDGRGSTGGAKEVTRQLNPFVDSLVSLLVSEPKTQVFSGTFSLNHRSCTLYLAANGEVPQSATARAKAIFDAMANLIDPSIARDGHSVVESLSQPGVPAKTTQFLVEQYQYSMPKFRARVNKRYHVFKQFMEVLDAQPLYRDTFSKEEQVKIQYLQDCLHNINLVLDINRAELTMPADAADYLSEAVHKVYDAWERPCSIAAKHPYKHENLVNKIEKTYKDMKDSSVAGMPDREFPLCHWLRKVISLRVDSTVVLGMAASKRLRPYYVVAKFEVVAVPSSPRSINVDLSRSAVEKAVLWASGPSELSEDTLADACDAIANFRLSPSAGPNPHCECSLIAFLRRTQTVTIPYIGVSKLSCLACHCYIEAYNTTLSPPSPGFQTAGCHGCYIAGWVPPSVGLPDQDLQIETSMVARLRSMFAGHLSTIETRNRTQSQSTAASSGSRTGTLTQEDLPTYNPPGLRPI